MDKIDSEANAILSIWQLTLAENFDIKRGKIVLKFSENDK